MTIMSLRLSLSVSVIALAVATPVYATQSPVLRVRQGNFATGTHRVVLDMTRLPNALPTVAETATGWMVNFEDRDGRSLSTAVTVPRGQAVTRTFYLAKTKSRPARVVIDFVAAQALIAPPIETTAAPAPIMTVQEQVTDVFGSAPADRLVPHTASTVQLSGFIEAEARWFPKTSDDGIVRTFFGSVAAEPKLKISASDTQTFTLTGFGRVDTATAARTHVDVREAKYEGRFGAFDMTLGLDRRFWGQLEAGHLVDVINQIDTLEDVDGEDKLGQPLAELKWSGRQASFAIIALPYFRDRLFPQSPDRPNAPSLVTGKAMRSGTSNHWTPDFAARGTLTAGPVDIALHYFNGLNRAPRLVPMPGGLAPVYDRMSQVGGDVLAVFGPVRLKAEGYYRSLRNDKMLTAPNHGGFGVGADYNMAGVFGAGDVNLLAEFYHDTGGKQATTIFDSDVFVGVRYTGNDISSTEVLGGLLFDTRRSSKLLTIEASRRIAAAFKLSLDVRLPLGVAADDPLSLLRDDGFVQLKAQFHF
jgi:hypothetical protein